MIKLTILISLFLFGTVLFRSLYYIPSDEIPITEETAEKIKVVVQDSKNSGVKSALFSYPLRLIIPEIEVDAKVQHVGITRKGNMAAPNNFKDVGWYKYGTIPGRKGSAVIAGHVDNGLSLPAIFKNLEKLKEGDDIYVITKEEKTLHFIVVGSTVYDFDAKPSEVFKEDDGKFLKLITCTGTWLKNFKTRDSRLVVKAVLVE